MRLSVRIVVIGDSREGLTLRSILEAFHCDVDLSFIGQPSDLRDLLAETKQTHFLIISGHGDQGGFWMGEFGPKINTSLLDDGVFGAKAFSCVDQVPRTHVISTACETGNETLAKTLFKLGANSFLAPSAWPEGPDVLAFLTAFFYRFVNSNGDEVKEIFLQTQLTDPKFMAFQLFMPEKP